MTIRAASFPDDLEAVRRIFAGYFAEFRDSLGTQDFDMEMRDLAARYDGRRQWLFVAECAGAVVGVVGLKDIGNGTGELKRMVVAPEARGSGIGKRLAEHALGDARRRGWTAVLLDTTPPMKTARGIYEALGFKERGPYYGSPLCGAIFMEARIG